MGSTGESQRGTSQTGTSQTAASRWGSDNSLVRAAYLIGLVALLWVVVDRVLGVHLTEVVAGAITATGAEWVMYVLMALSVAAGGVWIERLRYYGQRRVDGEAALAQLTDTLSRGATAEAIAFAETLPGMEGAVTRACLAGADRSVGAAREGALAALAQQRQRYERNLLILGTLGNNAPFIGLFGTVLGIVKAFVDLSRNIKGGAAAVMSGISEALVATAIGLLVAIPCVVAFNMLKARVRGAVTNSETLVRTVVGHIERDDGDAERGARGEGPVDGL